MTIEELTAKRHEALRLAQDLLKHAEKEGRDFTDAEESEFAGYEDEAKSLADQIAKAQQRADRLAAINAELDKPNPRKAAPDSGKPKTDDLRVSGGDVRNDDTKTFGFKHFGEQLQAIAKASKGFNVDQRLLTKAPLGANLTTDSEGGFLAAPEFSREIIAIMHEEDNLLDRTQNFAINGPSIKIPGFDETSRADGSRRGGVRGYWLAEADTLTASQPKFRQIELAPHKLGVLVYATDEMLEDGSDVLGTVVRESAASEINFKIGDAIVNGSGAGQPQGVLNAAATVSVSKETGQAANTIVPENVTKMWSRLHKSARANSVWLINQDCEPQLHLMSLAVGTGGQVVYMPPGGLSGQPYATLYGRPVVETEFNPTLGTVGDIVLADLSHYYTATRGSLKSDVSMHVQFLTDQMAFRFIFKVDGQSSWHSALTPFKGTNTQSPFITLATRA